MKRLEITPEITGLEVRAAGDGPEHFTIQGHAAVFGRLSENLGGFREQIHPDAFNRVLGETPDVRLLIDHDPSTVLARTTNGTLDLRPSGDGLKIWARIRADLPEAAGLRVRLDSKLVDQMSFAFSVDKSNDVRVGEDEAGVPIYEVREVKSLYDVSTVTYGAYPQTDVGLVRMRMVDDKRDGWLSPNDIRAAERQAQEAIARALADRPEQRENSPAAEVPAAVVIPDRELIRKRLALRKKARLLVATYPLG